MKKNIKIGVVCLARKTFDYEAAKEIYDRKKIELRKIQEVTWEIVEDLVIEVDESIEAGKYLASKDLDGIMIISGTFHLGHLALTIDKYVRKPILLWAFKELPYDGGKIRLNSVCGINLNASNLYKAGNDQFVCWVSDDIYKDWIEAVRIKSILNNAHVGIAGYRADGFFNLSVSDLSTFANTGILIDHYELADLYKDGVKEPECEETKKCVHECFDCSGINETQAEKVAYLADAMEQFMNKNKLDALAIRCWPEFASTYGVSPCAAMSLLGAKDYILGCEGDVEGTLSILACKAVADEPPFLADLSQVNFEEDYALMWHCGVAAYSLWDQKSNRSLDTYFAGGKGVTAGFVLKEGTVTIVRIDTARGKTRLFLQTGEALSMEKQLTGTYAKVRFNKPVKEVLDIVTSTGVAHHVAMIYGDHSEKFRLYAKMMGFEIIE
ncbi:MAG: L-fucose isomerase family protein [Clostridia bacterium]|jgi:L-fucose isomerase-like protein|nr:L-fucose isomerase family protein [Clostridia bacterium]